MMWYYAVLAGAGGGALRALLGLRKALQDPKLNFKWGLAITSILLGAGIGGVSMLIPGGNYFVCVGNGFMGDDIIEGFLSKKKSGK